MNDKTLREAFLRRLTVDSPNQDRRFRGYNQAIFIPEDEPQVGGKEVFTSTDLWMVMRAFDNALRDVHQAEELDAKALKQSMDRITDHR